MRETASFKHQVNERYRLFQQLTSELPVTRRVAHEIIAHLRHRQE